MKIWRIFDILRIEYTSARHMSSLPQHLDLHLIRILYLLLVEKNVSRVALKLNQPQPSISASLRKLRELTGDPLLVRGARGMVPTQHGESLLKPAKRILDETESLFVKKSPFVPRGRSAHLPHRRAGLPRQPVFAERGGGAAARLAQQPRGDPQPGRRAWTTSACCRTATWISSSPTGTNRPPTCTSPSCSKTRSSAPCAPTARTPNAPPATP